MSYARFSKECDVYVFATEYGDKRVIECCACAFTATNSDGPWAEPFPQFSTISGILEHLGAHREAGHKVPAYVSESIKADAWLGPWLEGIDT